MKIKGTVVKSMQDYIKEKHSEKYNEWFDMLPSESKKIFSDIIFASEVYELIDGIIKPTEVVAVLFFNADTEKAAYECGKYSGYKALKSVYRIFLKITSVDFVLRRAASIFSAYYASGKLETNEYTDEYVKFAISGLNNDEKLALYRISGWADALFTVISNPPSSVTCSVVNENDNEIEGEIIVRWK